MWWKWIGKEVQINVLYPFEWSILQQTKKYYLILIFVFLLLFSWILSVIVVQRNQSNIEMIDFSSWKESENLLLFYFLFLHFSLSLSHCFSIVDMSQINKICWKHHNQNDSFCYSSPKEWTQKLCAKKKNVCWEQYHEEALQDLLSGLVPQRIRTQLQPLPNQQSSNPLQSQLQPPHNQIPYHRDKNPLWMTKSVSDSNEKL